MNTETKKTTEQPFVRPVTRALIGNVLQAVESLTIIPGDVTPPAWIDQPDWFVPPAGTPPFMPPCPAREVIACQNGFLHVAANKLYPPTPCLFTFNALDFAYDAAAPEPTTWISFLEELWPDDPSSIAALQEWFGYCLLPDTSQQKILLIVGPKRSGKETIARVLCALIGANNTAGPTLASLSGPLGLWPLVDKTLAVISDARLSGRTDAAIVTERLLAISGENAITIERKNLSAVTRQLFVRFMLLTNELPRLTDSSGALVSRMIVLRMVQSWYGREDIALTKKLLAELPGILLWALTGYKRLKARGAFLQPESSQEMIDDLDDLSSPIGAFVRDWCEVGPGFEIAATDLFTEWKQWCEMNGKREAGTVQTFGRDLRAYLPQIKVRQIRLNDVRTRCYVGIRIKNVDQSARIGTRDKLMQLPLDIR